MRETISDSKLGILSLTFFPYLGKTKMTINIKIRNNPLWYPCSLCKYSSHLKNSGSLYVYVYTIFMLSFKLDAGSRILYDMRNGMHLALVILEETNLDICNII